MIKKIKSVNILIRKMLFVLNERQRLFMVIVLMSALLNALLQTLGVSIFVPLVSLMTDSNYITENKWMQMLCNALNTYDSAQLLIVICIFTILLYIIKNSFGIFQLWLNAKFSNNVQRELAVSLLQGYITRDYEFFLNYRTSQIIRDIFTDTQGVYVVMNSFFTIVTELLTMTMILVYIIAMDVLMALWIGAIAVICMWIIYKYFRKRMREAGEKKRIYSAVTNKILLESVEGIKEVKVMRRQAFFVQEFRESYEKQLLPSIILAVGSGSPTYMIEALFVSGIIAFMSIRIIFDPDYITALPVLASFMMGGVRMLPSLGRISANLNDISFCLPSLESLYNNMRTLEEENRTRAYDKEGIHTEKIVENVTSIQFANQLVLNNVYWKYKGSAQNVIEGLYLTIKKGQAVGIIGASGAGKSTVADLILGLHHPHRGTVEVDGKDIKYIPYAYSQIIGFVPQTIYLVDGTIRENVAFGTAGSNIDDELVWNCLERAQIAEFVKNLEDGIDTVIGERGVRFSGGQRQRIAIARALYRKPQILVLDEATSALDNETEDDVMRAIESLYGAITMIIIAHRLTTVRKCDVVYEVTEGKAVIRDKNTLEEK